MPSRPRPDEDEGPGAPKRVRHSRSHAGTHIAARETVATQARRSRAQQVRHKRQWTNLSSLPSEPAHAVGIALVAAQDMDPHYLGSFDDLCMACGARHWVCERPRLKQGQRVVFGLCCASGSVTLPAIFDAPSTLERLYQATTTQSKNFLEALRMYNNVFSFTSLGTDEKHLSPQSNGTFTFKVRGALHHRIGSLYPEQGARPRFAQIYFYDPGTEAMTSRRISQFPASADKDTLSLVQSSLMDVNPYVKTFRTARERLELQGDAASHVLRILNESVAQGRDPRTYHRPTVSEVAAIVLGSENDPGATSADRHIVIQQRSGGLQFVTELHSAYLPLRYPMLIPYGHSGWHSRIPRTNGVAEAAGPVAGDVEGLAEPEELRTGRVSQLDFYAYHLQDRTAFSTLLRARRLLQEFAVDAWCQIEAGRLRWHALNQKTVLRLATRDAIQAAASEGAASGDVGKRVILPGTFVNGPKFWTNLYHDAMAIVRARGKPDLFITMTTNPAWREIQEALLPGQAPQDRPDIVARVFNAKLKYLQDLLLAHSVFGPAVAMVRTTEFQKRGLPHAHILVILHKDHKPDCAEDVDRIVSAEVPDPHTHPRLHDIVMNTMVHGPCGEGHACMKEGARSGRCGKGYPQPFRETTMWGNNTYPRYRRREDGRVFYKRTDRGKHFAITNQHIAPYNPWLTLALNAHVNVEVASSITAVKYLYKYIYKGPDRVTVTLSDGSSIQQEDEIRSYLDARYVSAAEACTRIYEYPLHSRSPAVEDLPIHLPDKQTVLYDATRPAEDILAQPPPRTKLTAFFDLCKTDPRAKGLTYSEVPLYFTWHKKERSWHKRTGKASVGRIQHVHSLSDERYFLRMLLYSVKSPKSFEDLLKVGDVDHTTFRGACQTLGLLSDDKEWSYCLQEAGSVKHAASVRELFCIIVCNNLVSNPGFLFDQHFEILSDDCARKLDMAGIDDTSEPRIRSLCLSLISQILMRLPGERQLEELGLDVPNAEFEADLARVQDPSIAREALAREQRMQLWQRAEQGFTPQQREVYDSVCATVFQHRSELFFLDGPGGTGKTFLENAILARLRTEGITAVAVASSGIAALLLEDGRTAHSFFKIPIEDLGANSTCSISRESTLGRTLAEARLVIWDEAPMTHRLAVEAVDRSMRDIRGRDVPFGGVTVLFSGDWRQTLPVVPHAGPGQVVSACLHHAPFWNQVQVMHLTQNLRLRGSDEDPGLAQANSRFAEWLLDVGSGKNLADDGYMPLPPGLLVEPREPEVLVERVYPQLASKRTEASQASYFKDRMILFARNKDVDACNDQMVDAVPGDARTIYSTDSALTDQRDGNLAYPTEYLNSLHPSGFPGHVLRLKPGTPVVLLRNLDPTRGLCNGTRLLVKEVSSYLLRCKILNGAAAAIGQDVLLPRITLHTGTNVYPFKLSRTQFPVRLAFAMTINKSQGQSLDTVGIDLREPAFSHGQLYVALSRARRADRVHVLLPDAGDRTPNIVYPNALL